MPASDVAIAANRVSMIRLTRATALFDTIIPATLATTLATLIAAIVLILVSAIVARSLLKMLVTSLLTTAAATLVAMLYASTITSAATTATRILPGFFAPSSRLPPAPRKWSPLSSGFGTVRAMLGAVPAAARAA